MLPVSAYRNISNAQSTPISSTQAPQAPQPPPSHGGMPQMDSLSSILFGLNTNPYLVGILMLLLNLGGRFLSLELTKKQESFLQQSWLRPLIFFTVIFVATRNLAVAFWITIFFFFIIWVVANENSPFCLIPGWRSGKPSSSASPVYEKNMEVIEHIEHIDHNEHTHDLTKDETDSSQSQEYQLPYKDNSQ